MSAVPAGLSTEQGPPMSVPLAHFVVGFGFLLGACGLAGYAGLSTDPVPVTGAIHLFLAGWVGITIVGAMTQFVPVWSGVALYSRRAATAQLWLVTAGVPLIGAGITTTRFDVVLAGGALALLGFWLFAYNLARTLARTYPFDVTELHFACALGFLLLATAAGLSLAAVYAGVTSLPVDAGRLLAAHATLAVFGAVLTTVFGALYQLATMFTQTELRGVEHRLQAVETCGYPAGVLALAAGRLAGVRWLALAGAALVAAGVTCVGVILARRVLESSAELTPMLRRYGVVAIALLGWAVFTVPAWMVSPLDPASTLGPGGADWLLLFGVVGFVVVGTLYHIVPFIVWVDHYSDRLGHEPVPMVDDLYDARVAAVDLAAMTVAVGLLVADGFLGVAGLAAAGLALGTVGIILFVANMTSVLVVHGPSVPSLLSALRPV